MKKILLSIISLTSFASFGQSIFRDNLSTYNTGVQLNGQGTWSYDSSLGGGGAGCLSCHNLVLGQGVSYLDYGTATKTLEIKPDSDGIGTLFTPVTTDNVYFGFVFNISNAQFSGSMKDLFRISSGAFSYPGRVYLKKTISGSSFIVGVEKTSGSPIYGTTEYSFNTDHLIIIKYTKNVGASDDIIKAYVDPVFASGEPVTAEVSNANGTDNTSPIKAMNFYLNNNITTLLGRAGLFSVSSSWNALTLATTSFNKSTFTIISNNVKNGLLEIKSNVSLQKATLNIYDIQGRVIDTQKISLEETINNIVINPVRNAGVYVVEILSESNQRFTQKILVD